MRSRILYSVLNLMFQIKKQGLVSYPSSTSNNEYLSKIKTFSNDTPRSLILRDGIGRKRWNDDWMNEMKWLRWTVSLKAFGAKLLKIYIILHLLELFFQKERFLQLLPLRGYLQQVRVVIRAPQTSIMIIMTKIVSNVDFKTFTIFRKEWS